jgi:hypothetical protein
VLVEIEPPGLETNTKQLLLQPSKLRQKRNVVGKNVPEILVACRNEQQYCMGRPR